jgi:hypothetical protein
MIPRRSMGLADPSDSRIHHRLNLAALGVLSHVNKVLEYRTDLLVTRIFRAENVHATFPSNDAAAIAHDFDG